MRVSFHAFADYWYNYYFCFMPNTKSSMPIPASFFKTILQRSMQEMLLDMNTKNELLEFADLFGLPYRESYKKSLLAEIIEIKVLEHPEVLMKVLPKEELLSLQKIVHAGGYLKSKEELNCFELEYRSIVFRPKVDPNQQQTSYFEYILPGNLQNRLHQVIDKLVKDPRVNRWDKWDRIFIGLLQIYGVLPQTAFLNLWEKVTGEALDLADFLKMIRKRAMVRGLIDPFFVDEKLCVANSMVHNPRALLESINNRKELDYCPYPLEVVMMSVDSYLTIAGNNNLMPIVMILDDLNGGDDLSTSVQLTNIWTMHQNGATVPELITFLSKQFRFDNAQTVTKVMSALTTLVNALPNWSLKGHTPDALYAKRPSRQVVPVVPKSTIGRNDPCPCGSGKKYKKCCGAK